MTSTELGLLDDICKNPEDVTLRLIYADWLEDQGNTIRSNFIRVQCRDHTSSTNIDNWLTVGDLFQIDRIFDKREGWLVDINRRLQKLGNGEHGQPNFGVYEWNHSNHHTETYMQIGDEAKFIFRRGFIEEIHAPLDRLMRHLPEMVSDYPILKVKAVDCTPWPYDEATEAAWHLKGAFILDTDRDIGDELPKVIFSLLSGRLGNENRARYYVTNDEAYDDLSNTLLKLAKNY